MLTDRILDTLRANGPIAAGEFPKWFAGIDRISLDEAVSWLLRKNSISFAFNRYEWVERKTNGLHTPFVAMAVSEAPPTAAEEVAASLKPATVITRERIVCPGCRKLRFDAEFRHSALGKRFTICKYCESAKTQETRQKRYESNLAGGRATLTAEDSLTHNGESSGPDRLPPDSLKGPEGECPQAPLPAHGTTSKPVVIEPQGNAGESLPSNSTNACGEAQRPRTAGPCRMEGPAANTPEKRGNNRDVSAERCCDVASVSGTPESYSRSDPREDVRTPAGSSIAFPRNDGATGRVADSVLDRLAGKRTVLVLRRERLRVEYEAAQGAVEFEIERIDGVVGSVMKLLGEGN